MLGSDFSEGTPRIANEGFDSSARDLIRAVDRQLGDVPRFELAFSDALALFDFCTERRNAVRAQTESIAEGLEEHTRWQHLNEAMRKATAWQHIAGREGALSIWDFGHNIHQLFINTRKCSPLGALEHVLFNPVHILRL
ncbi:hypothetical protein [Mesorhizobium sp. M1322]|uniref:hypothetical protein n=1 Tax=Mesorhizobium sp. M1322 TaxID=2957081 RepID=UPI00333E11A2